MSEHRARPPLRRLPDEGAIAGVCTGIARHLGVPAPYVQVAMVVLAAFGGVGIAIYALGWALLPVEAGAAAGGGWRLRDLRGSGLSREIAGVALLTLAGLLALRELGLWLGDELVWPLLLGSTGVALIVRQADESAAWTPAELRHPLRGLRDRLRGDRGADGRRTVLGAALVAAAAYVLLRSTGTAQAVGNAIGGIVVLAAAAALVFGPWLGRMARSLADERTERIRSQERAEVAAHLHDSVLQTLALIQKRASDPREVASLARRQERELRSWLNDRPAKPAGESVVAALEEAAAELERLHGVPVEVVAVGDCPLDERTAALVGAAREAIANAAKFAGSEQIDLYVEVGGRSVEAFVRDRGVGFDPSAVPADRRGVRESIVGRMERHGGRAVVHSAPGAGTEVELTVERAASPETAGGGAPPTQAARPGGAGAAGAPS
ncbi:ATP-binding protein [Conexibacter arvalis]|uniref:Phage shock protein PspC (Stress-responsive transcriptional regulator)/gas vesicle protein n=1 Tax=Conexibacter arvalis TaxID=912552 RepID=A0A840IEM1_9ACTN|nr:ATP-binding protein [Conexibacter arvalis]MBB4662653.1 phage shock protein PspC (stress-responsive transcriptional regulator)/gas vesicle protein [Conexibacter arvalis]